MSNDEEKEAVAELHEAIAAAFRKVDTELADGRILTGWVVIAEHTDLAKDGISACGSLYGPHEMTTWRALGLLEWARRFTLTPEDNDEEHDHDD